MWDWMRRILAPPAFEDEEIRRVAGPLYMFLLILCLASLVIFFWILIYYDDTPTTHDQVFSFVSSVGNIFITLGLLWLLRRGYVRQTGLLVAIGIWILITLWIYSSGWIIGPTITGYFLVIAIVGIVLGASATLVAGLICLLSIAGAFYAQYAGWIPAPLGQLHVFDFIVLAATFSSFTLLLRFSVYSINVAFLRTKSNTSTLIAGNRELKARIQRGQRIEAELQQLNEFHENIVQSMTEGVVIQDTAGYVIFLNPAAANLLGHAPHQLLGKHWTVMFPPDQHHIIYSADERQRQGETDRYEVDLLRKDGGRTPVLVSGSPRFSDTGEFLGTLAVFTDITDYKQTENRLKDSEARHRNMIDTAPDGILILNLGGIVTACNAAFLTLTGYSEREIVGRHFTQLPTTRLKDSPKFMRTFSSLIHTANSDPIDFAWHHRDGTTRWAQARVSLIRQESRVVGMQAVMRDTTASKRTEQLTETLNRAALATAQSTTLDEIFDAVSKELWRIEVSCIVFYTNEDQNKLYPKYFSQGRKTIKIIERLVQENAHHFVVPVNVSDVFEKVIWNRETVWVANAVDTVNQFQLQPLRKLCQIIVQILQVSRSINTPLVIEDRVIGLFSVQSEALFERDMPMITAFAHQLAAGIYKAQLFQQMQQELSERKLAEAEITRLQNLLQNVTDSMPSAMIALDSEGKVLLWNPSAATLAHRTLKDIQNQSLWDACPQLVGYRDLVDQVLTQGEIVHERRQPFPTGTEMTYHNIDVFPLMADDIEGVVLRIDDVTQWIHLEQMMLHSAKMASVGGLAAGVAHEINNPLASMMQGAQMLHMALDVSRPQTQQRLQEFGVNSEALSRYMHGRNLSDYLSGIRDAGERAAKIVADLLSFSRKNAAHVQTYDINDLLIQTLELAGTDYDLQRRYDFQNVEIAQELATDLPAVVCDGQQIQQVILNLMRNAAQAMTQKLAQKKTKANQYKPHLILRTKRNEVWIRLEVEDNGPGVSESARSRLFSPFFTTKDVGEGTGLGLWLCWTIVVERHNGHIWMEPVVDETTQPNQMQGSRFIIELPITSA